MGLIVERCGSEKWDRYVGFIVVFGDGVDF